jgi:hypothetical protein
MIRHFFRPISILLTAILMLLAVRSYWLGRYQANTSNSRMQKASGEIRDVEFDSRFASGRQETTIEWHSPRLTGTDLIRQSVVQLQHLPAIRASLFQSVDLFGQSLQGRGVYLQSAAGANQNRCDLVFESDGLRQSMSHINDGRFLYLRNVGNDGEVTLERIDLARCEKSKPLKKPVSQSAAGAQAVKPQTKKGEVAKDRKGSNEQREPLVSPDEPPPLASLNWNTSGGLVHLLSALDDAFEFGDAYVSDLNGLSALTIEGNWKPSRLENIKTWFAGNSLIDQHGLQASGLPEHTPMKVSITFSNAQPLRYFPHRIVYYSERRFGEGFQLQPILILEWSEVQVVDQLPLNTFQIEQNDNKLSDQTDSFLRSIRLLRR